jgi:hypothetical protein
MSEGPTQSKRLRVSPSIIISIFALVIAMSTGAYAAVIIAPKNSVVSKSIKNGTIKAKDVANNTLSSGKIKDGTLTAADIGDGQVGTNAIGDGQVGLNDLSATAKTDLNDASTLGGLTVAQIVTASGGEYVEAKQGADADIEVTPDNRVTVATLNIPHAGKWLINARIPVVCTWDGTGGGGTDPEPAETGLDQPNFPAQGWIQVGAAAPETQNESCEVETAVLVFIVPFYSGSTTIQFTKMVTTTGPTTVTLKASGAPSDFFGIPLIPGFKVNVTATESMIQGITVQ